jgi:hypothetical protein
MVLRTIAVVLEVALGDAKERHGKDPADEDDERRECGGQRHEDRADAVIGCATQTKEDGEARETGANGDEDQGVGEVVERPVVQRVVVVAEISRIEFVADG